MSNGRTNWIWPEFLQAMPCRVLELGPYDGRDSVLLARHCDSLVIVEGRLDNLATTQRAMGWTPADVKVQFIHANLETYDLTQLGRFDCVWASGILYHLPLPWLLVRQLASLTDLCLGWTHLATAVRETKAGYGGWAYTEHDPATSLLSGLSGHSFWLVESEFVRMWGDCGFGCCFYEAPQPHVHGGVAGQFAARREVPCNA